MASLSSTVHRFLHDWARANRYSPLTAALALEMMRGDDPPVRVLACWWIAVKFEETDHGGMWACDVVDASPCRYTLCQMRVAEAQVLQRLAWVIPHRTSTSALFECLGPGHDAWLHALLRARVHLLFSAPDWAEMIKDAVAGTRLAPVVQLLHHLLPRRMRLALGVCLSVPSLIERDLAFQAESLSIHTPQGLVGHAKKRKASDMSGSDVASVTPPTVEASAMELS
jgi:hypothetical protein